MGSSLPKRVSCIIKSIIVLFLLIFLVSQPAYAFSPSRASYYDWGPYYSGGKVLGLTFSSLEQLPVPNIPAEVIPPAATGILPGSPLHLFETFIENVQLTFASDPIAKETLRLSIAAERLSEAKTLTEQNHPDLAADAISSYSDVMVTISDNLRSLAVSNTPGIDNLVERVETATAAHAVLAQNLALSSPPAVASTWNSVASSTEAVMDAAADASAKPPIPQDLSTSIQSLKEQGLITPEQSDKLYSFDSRSEVRDELDKLASSGQFPLAEVVKLDQAIAENYPNVYKETVGIYQFAELRAYQTLPPPSEEIAQKIAQWRNQADATAVSPPADIRPYLYVNRAEELAKNIDFSNFTADQQGEVVKFYPQAAEDNPTFSVSPSPTPQVSPTPTTDPTSPDTSPTPTSPSLPTPTPPTAAPYVTAQSGALPGDTTYFLKQFGEQLSLVTTFDPARRLEIQMRYAEERLREASALSKSENKVSLYEDTLKRYQDAIENVSESVKDFAGDKEDKEKLAKELQAEAARHNVVFEKGLLPPPSEDTKVYTQVIEATENAMDRSADALGRPAIPAALANRLQDLKVQGLVLSEEVDQLNKSESRGEVREKVRKLMEIGSFPPADAKKLDEGQVIVSPYDYNQLVEVRKVEELQRLRAVQADFAQTPTLKTTADVLSGREKGLIETIDISLIKPEDLTGRDDLKVVYDKLAAENPSRPVNRGQFGSQPPAPADAVLTTCPVGAAFSQNEGCVWADTGKKLNDYEQYRCDGPGQYYSFAAKKCTPSERGGGFGDDASPVCPAGYNWVWQNQSCQTSTGGTTPKPTPASTPAPDPGDANSCPAGSSYQSPNGCVWDASGKSVADSTDYNCKNNQYYSFKEFKCVPYPKPGEVSPNDFVPSCQDPDTYWSWSDGKCTSPKPIEGGIREINIPQPSFVPPGNPLYFVKQWGEGLQRTFTFTPQAREQVSLAQAKERLAEAAYALKKDDKAGVKAAITSYISMMQNIVADVSREGLSEGAKQEIAKSLSDGSVEQNLMLSKLSAWAKEEDDDLIQAATSTPILGVDKASDILGEPPIPDDIKAKIEALPAEMISEENKKKLLEADSRVAVRVELTNLSNIGGLGRDDVVFLNDDFNKVEVGAQVELEELSKLAEIADITNQKQEINEKVEKNENIVTKLDEFQKGFEPGKEISAEIRPYVRLTRIEEVAQTIRPDIVNLGDFGNRRDVQLAVATLKEEFKPTVEAIRKLEDFRRSNPGRALPFELARIEALSFGLGVRGQAESCFLPTPPFPPNTPCPAPGAAIPISSYRSSDYGAIDPFLPGTFGRASGGPSGSQSVDKDGKPLVYGQGPKAERAGVCPDGYHWMYDSGGWCMSNSGSYSSGGGYTPSGGGQGYTPYSPYYNAPGSYPGTGGYPVGDTSPNDGCPYGFDSDGRGNCIRNSYPSSPYNYSPPSYYGPATTNYTTDPPPGTVPGTGVPPTAPGQCPTGFHWMSDNGGWCMSNGNTYVPPGSGPYSPNLNQSSCGPGYYWDGRGCIPTYSGPTAPYPPYNSQCTPPSSGCGSSSYWDYGRCSCRPSGTYPGGGPNPDNSCQGISCGGGSYLDYSSCSCRYSPSGPTSPTYPSPSCSPPSGGCGSGWFDYGSCSCKQSSPQGCYNVSASSCGSGWYFDSAACTCRQSTSTGGTTTSGGSTSSGSCPSGYHWMSDNGGWCMSDSASSPSSSTTSTTTTTTSSPTPDTTTTNTTTTTTESSSPPPSTTTESSSPPPSSTTTTESAPPPSP